MDLGGVMGMKRLLLALLIFILTTRSAKPATTDLAGGYVQAQEKQVPRLLLANDHNENMAKTLMQ
jgi:hypothetical protein